MERRSRARRPLGQAEAPAFAELPCIAGERFATGGTCRPAASTTVEQRGQREQEDLQVQGRRPVLDVEVVVLDPLCQRGLTA